MFTNVGRYSALLLAVLVLAAVFLVVSGRPGLTVGPAQTPSTPVPTAIVTPTSATPASPLGDPSGVSASMGVIPDSPPGSIVLRWTPASNATLHLIYLVNSDGSDGRYLLAPDGAYVETVTGLEIGQTYWFTVIAGLAGAGNEPMEWSQWSDWVTATPVLPGLPPPPIRPQASVTPTGTTTPSSTVTPSGTPTPTIIPTGTQTPRNDVEIEGNVVSVDAAAKTFVVQVVRHEYFGGSSPPSQVTVDYSQVGFIANWIQTGLYVEAEGSYDSASATLSAREVEREDRDDDDDDDDDDD